jgi:hypothetical protein
VQLRERREEEEIGIQHGKKKSPGGTILNDHHAENRPAQRVDQLIQLVEEHLHLPLLVAPRLILPMYSRLSAFSRAIPYLLSPQGSWSSCKRHSSHSRMRSA